MHRIHIVGVNPRTGTTLLAECMRLCFEIDRAEGHEANIFRLRPCRGVYLTKNPRDIEEVGLRLRLDPRFSAICMVRDPRDVIVSKHGQDPDKYWYGTSFRWFRRRWAIAQQLEGHPRFMIVRYEDLIEHPDEIQAEIGRRFPFLKTRAKFSQFHELGTVSKASRLALNGVRAIDPTNKSKWTDHLNRLRDVLEKSGSINEALIAMGYEKDNSWLKAYDFPDKPPHDESASKPRRFARRKFASVAATLACAVLARTGIPIG